MRKLKFLTDVVLTLDDVKAICDKENLTSISEVVSHCRSVVVDNIKAISADIDSVQENSNGMS